MNWQVNSPFANAVPHTLELDTRYPKRKREKVTYDEYDTEEFASSYSEDDHVPVKKVTLPSLELTLMCSQV